MKKYVLLLIILVPFLQYSQKKIKFPNVFKVGILTPIKSGSKIEYYKDFRSFDVGASVYSIKYEANYAPMNKNLFSNGYSYPMNQIENFSLLLGKRFVIKKDIGIHLQLGGTYNNYNEVNSWEQKNWLLSYTYEYHYQNKSIFGLTSRVSFEVPFSKSIGFALGGYYNYDTYKQHYGISLNLMFGNLHL